MEDHSGEDRYWLETSCMACRRVVIHSMAQSLKKCENCGSRRVTSKMIREEVVMRLLSRRGRSSP